MSDDNRVEAKVQPVHKPLHREHNKQRAVQALEDDPEERGDRLGESDLLLRRDSISLAADSSISAALHCGAGAAKDARGYLLHLGAHVRFDETAD